MNFEGIPTLQSPSGDEKLANNVGKWNENWHQIIFEANNFGNVGASNDDDESKIHILVTAHADEIFGVFHT
jgi:putative aminopeptidase FrvX